MPPGKKDKFFPEGTTSVSVLVSKWSGKSLKISVSTTEVSSKSFSDGYSPKCARSNISPIL